MGGDAASAVERTGALVVGGGVVGCAVLRELATRGIEALLLDAQPDVGEGTSKANSAILHTGFDATPGTVEAEMLRRARELWPPLLDELGVPFLRCGALMIARDEAAREPLLEVASLAGANGVGVEVVGGDVLHDLAPFVNPEAVAALSIPEEGIIDPFWLTRAFAESALADGARLRTGATVTSLDVGRDTVRVGLADGSRIDAGHVFDCAGLWADEVARLAGDTSFSLSPRKGQFLVSERTFGVDRIVLPIPGRMGKGMLVTPIVFGGVLLGPTAEDGTDKNDRSTSETGREAILRACVELVPDVARMDPIRSFAGARAVSSTGDYIVRASTAGDRLTIVAGIRSTGISASPAIAEAAVELASTVRRWERQPRTRAARRGPEFGPDAGPIVCVCRSIGAAEVDASLGGPLGAATTDGLKRRAGVGFGDCQGNCCLADSIARIATSTNTPPGSVVKGPSGSWHVVARVDSVTAPPPSRVTPATRLDVDVAIVGGGLAGIGAALTVVEAGLRAAVIDRRPRPGGALGGLPRHLTDEERDALATMDALVAGGQLEWWSEATAVGLGRSDRRWQIDVFAAAGGATVSAKDVILASGGYVAPREHHAIDGPRPSGVMTSDFVSDALDRGWRPAHRVVVVGRGRLADGIAERLTAAGVEVVERITETSGPTGPFERHIAVEAIGGDRRLESVVVGGHSIRVDGLVLAHALRPASFLLRGLGIGDDRPGVPMPADERGALPLAGLWAAGTCVRPSVDHEDSLEAGRAVAGAVVGLVPTGT